MKICPQCNIEYQDNMNFCPECGTKLETMTNVCLNCGTTYKEGQKFCSECGANLGVYSVDIEYMENTSELENQYLKWVDIHLKVYEYSYQEQQNAFQNLTTMAESGYPKAMLYIGKYYYDKYEFDCDHGGGYEEDITAALEWLHKVLPYYIRKANVNNPEAQCILADCYFHGYGVDRDYAKTVKWYQKASEMGSVEAECSLGALYLHGWTTEDYWEYDEEENKTDKVININIAKAIDWYTKAAMSGFVYAQCHLGDLYSGSIKNQYFYSFITESIDYNKAIKWYTMAIESGSIEAAISLSNLYRNKIKDNKKAIEWLEKAALAHSIPAMLKLGNLYEDITEYVKAIDWYKKLIYLNCDPNHINRRIGRCYYCLKDYKSAILYYSRVPENDEQITELIGDCYFMDNNFHKAIEWYKKAISYGYYVNGKIGDCYCQLHDYSQAVCFYEKGIVGNNGESDQFRGLGDCYFYGRGKDKNYALAYQYYKKAIDVCLWGNDKAQYQIDHYFNDKGHFIGDANKYSTFVIDDKMGILSISKDNDSQQKILVPAKYDLIYPFIKNHAIVKIGNSYGLIDKTGKETIPTIYLCLSPNIVDETYFVQEHGRDCYTVDANNKRLHRNGSNDMEKEFLKAKLSSKLGINEKIFLNNTNNPQVVSYYKDSERSKYGTPVYYYNTLLEKVICVSTKTKLVNGDKLIVKDVVSGKTGIVDVEGRQLVPAIYDDILYCATTEEYIPENLLEAKKDGKSGYIDFHGNIKIPFVYEYCGTFFNGLAWVSNEKGKIGLIDKTGRIVEPLIHHSIKLENDMWIIIDKDMFGEHYSIFGKPKDYVNQSFSHQRFSFNVFHNHNYVGVETSNKKRGVTDLQGNVLIPAIYDDMAFWQTMYKGIIVGKNGKYGVIDINNIIQTPFEYNCLSVIEVYRDDKKLAYYCGKKNGLFGVLDDNFNICIPFLYSRLEYNKVYNSFVVESNHKKAMIDLNNNILIPFSSHYITTV